MAIKGAIFDLDGVIVDTAKYHFLAWRDLAKELGFDFTEENNEALKGVSRMRSLEILLEVGGVSDKYSEQEKSDMAAKKNGEYVEYISRMDSSELLAGVEEFLVSLRGAGIKIALGSASRNAPLILDRVGICSLFDAVVDGSMTSQAKPDPEVFLLGAELLGLEASECVVFEDAQAGVEAAHRANMKCVGVGGSPLLSRAEAQVMGFDKLDATFLESI